MGAYFQSLWGGFIGSLWGVKEKSQTYRLMCGDKLSCLTFKVKLYNDT